MWRVKRGVERNRKNRRTKSGQHQDGERPEAWICQLHTHLEGVFGAYFLV